LEVLSPTTCNGAEGEVVPIPTSPVESIVILISDELKFELSAIPFTANCKLPTP